MIIPRKGQYAAMGSAAAKGPVAHRVDTAIQSRPFTIPKGKHTVVLRLPIQTSLLGTADRSGGQVFIDRWIKLDIMLSHEFFNLPVL